MTCNPTLLFTYLFLLRVVNGADGIGTGWSTNVPTYNPREIIRNIRAILSGQQPQPMKPWYRGFIGEVDAKNTTTYSIAGVIEQVDDSTILIKELPVSTWTNTYKQFLESMIIGNAAAATAKNEDGSAAAAPAPAIVKDFKENHTDTTVLFTVTLPPEKLQECLDDKNGIHRKFKLETTVATTNMNLFDLNSTIHKYETATDILYAFYDVRIEYYQKRKDHLTKKLTEEWEQLDNKVRFIMSVINGSLVVSNRKKVELFNNLKQMGFKQFTVSNKAAASGGASARGGNNDDEDDDNMSVNSLDSTSNVLSEIHAMDKGYDYLLSMKIWSLTQERVQALTAQRDEKHLELKRLSMKQPSDLWLEDLDMLEDALKAYEGEIIEATRLENIARNKASNDRKKNGGGGRTGGGGGGKSKKGYDSDEELSDDDDFDEDDEDDDFYGKKSKSKPKPKAAPAKKAGGGGSSGAGAVATKGVVIARKVIIEKEKPEKTVSVATSSASATG